MRRRISLYIDGRLADLEDESSYVLFNYTKEDSESPTIVKNSYSQSVTLPGTPANNVIFGNFGRLDRLTGSGFNAFSKTPFTIFSETNEILEKGYVKLESVSKKGNSVSYTITLYGGLGGFFYSLMYNSDGSKKTLADITLLDAAGETHVPSEEQFSMDAGTIKTAWTTLSAGTTGLWGVINFAPASNGIPDCDFSCDKAVCNTTYSPYANLYASATDDDDVTYGPMTGANNNILLEMENEHNEWEMQDLRAYLQRPVINAYYLLKSLTLSANSGDYNFALDDNFFESEANVWITKSWITLPMWDRDNRPVSSYNDLSALLDNTETPADYLIGFAKMFGLSFLYEADSNTITLMDRNTYYLQGYNAGVIDLTRRVSPEKTITPNLANAKYYIWQNETTIGEFAESYAENHKDRLYGSQYVNTGYPFEAEQESVLDTIYKGAADVLETNGNYVVYGGESDDQGAYTNYMFKFALTEEVSWKLYNSDSSKDYDCTPTKPWLAPFRYSRGTTNWADFMVKTQFHDGDGKAEDGSGVLLFYEGTVEPPTYTQSSVVIASVDFHLSNDTDEMLLLNDGKPCYDVSPTGNNIVALTSIPSFRRCHPDVDDTHDGIVRTFDLGTPQEIGYEEYLYEDACIYYRMWKKYIADRYDQDTKVVSCKVNLSGYQVNESLLRRFFYFDNSIWVLNKISNYSLTTYDLVDCEFIKVQDITNYTTGQSFE